MSKVSNICLAAVMALGITASTKALADEKSERQADALEVQNLVAKRDFRGLENLAKAERDQKLLGLTGIWRLQHFYTYLNGYFTAIQHGGNCVAPLPMTSLWFSAYPHSPTAIIANGKALEAAAFCFRGSGYADTVTAEGATQFNQYEKDAHDFLMAHRRDGMSDPQWYMEMEIISRATGADADDFMSFFKEGAAHFPLYYGLYDEGTIYFAPRWHGSNTDVERFIDLASERTKGAIGDDIYARLYWYYSDALYLRDLKEASDINWVRMRRSMDGLVQRYPDPWNLEQLARISCQSGDVAEGVKLLRQIRPAVDVSGWEKVATDGICDREMLP